MISDNSLHVFHAGYEIVHQKKSGSSPAEREMRGPNATSHSLMNLVYDSVYNISVRAKTRVGFGPAVTTEFSSAEPPGMTSQILMICALFFFYLKNN